MRFAFVIVMLLGIITGCSATDVEGPSSLTPTSTLVAPSPQIFSHYRGDIKCGTGTQSHIHSNTDSRPNSYSHSDWCPNRYACSDADSDSAPNTN